MDKFEVGTNLYEAVTELRKALMDLNLTKDGFGKLIASKENKNGEFYKSYFGEAGEDSYMDPAGNNLLLLAIAKGVSFCNLDETKTALVTEVANLLITDAKSKLSNEDFLEFVNFKFKQLNDWTEDYYDNTPLTLALKAGLNEVALKLINEGADVNQTCETYGNLSPLHIVLAKLPFVTADETKELVEALIEHKADISIKDSAGHSAADMLQFHAIALEDAPAFSAKREDFVGVPRGSKSSFIQLKNNKEFVEHAKTKGFENFDDVSPEHIHEFVVKLCKDDLNVTGTYIDPTSDYIFRAISYDARIKETADKLAHPDNGNLWNRSIDACDSKYYEEVDYHIYEKFRDGHQELVGEIETALGIHH